MEYSCRLSSPQEGENKSDLPTDRRNTVVLEIVNCGKKDCSVVVISN